MFTLNEKKVIISGVVIILISILIWDRVLELRDNYRLENSKINYYEFKL